MGAAENTALLHQAMGEFNKGNLTGYLELYGENAILRGYEGVEPGREGIRKFYETFMKIFPDGNVELNDVVTEEDKFRGLDLDLDNSG